MQEDREEESGEVEDMRRGEVNVKAGGEDFGKERVGLSIGRLTMHRHGMSPHE